jgi:drug/metabolite transporter (DMT)-like permease
MNLILQVVLCLHMLMPVAAMAQSVASKDPLSYPLKTYGFMLFVAILGGIVSFYAKVRRGEVAALSFMHLVGEITTSAFAGLLVFWLCEYLNVPQILTAPLVGISGHMGAKAIGLAEGWAKRKFDQTSGASA